MKRTIVAVILVLALYFGLCAVDYYATGQDALDSMAAGMTWTPSTV